ncbi:hypothetical protein FRC09_001486 [Ceratobasidium sp. 395]|nr:hypothetical protein FRC09_001486 [Ceratobasidium sp. 395]
MPRITPELILKQRLASYIPYPTPPASEHSPSPLGSPSSRPLQPRSYKPSGLTNDGDTCMEDRSNDTHCWIPTLEEVSRASPEQRRRLFQRLADEAKRDEQRASKKTRGSVPKSKPQTQTPAPRAASTSKQHSPHVGIGAVALQLIRPAANPPVLEVPLTPHPYELVSAYSSGLDEPAHAFNNSMDDYSLVRWQVDGPESPVDAIWKIIDPEISKETISQWMEEDKEYERRLAEEHKLRLMGMIE